MLKKCRHLQQGLTSYLSRLLSLETDKQLFLYDYAKTGSMAEAAGQFQSISGVTILRPVKSQISDFQGRKCFFFSSPSISQSWSILISHYSK